MSAITSALAGHLGRSSSLRRPGDMITSKQHPGLHGDAFQRLAVAQPAGVAAVGDLFA